MSDPRPQGAGARLLARALEWGVETLARGVAKGVESVMDDTAKAIEQKRAAVEQAKDTVKAWRNVELGDDKEGKP